MGIRIVLNTVFPLPFKRKKILWYLATQVQILQSILNFLMRLNVKYVVELETWHCEYSSELDDGLLLIRFFVYLFNILGST